MRKKIEYETDILIKTAPYKDTVTWKEVNSIAYLLKDEDIVCRFKWIERDVKKFWGDQDDHDGETEYALFMVVQRTREETDEEYVERLKREQVIKDDNEKREFETYLKLKGKYEK